MFIKYRHNAYQMLRTAVVLFFQIAFAFMIPEILVRFNMPYFDFKNAWPLDYDFFFDWNINSLIASGNIGVFMFVWGVVLTLIIVPVMVYFFGKRWYCSWVCGCGGLAETLGDPYRQLSSKTLTSWKIERYLIHGVLVFAILMTAMTLYTYFFRRGYAFRNKNLRFTILLRIFNWLSFFWSHRNRFLPNNGESSLVSIWMSVGSLYGNCSKVQIALSNNYQWWSVYFLR